MLCIFLVKNINHVISVENVFHSNNGVHLLLFYVYVL